MKKLILVAVGSLLFIICRANISEPPQATKTELDLNIEPDKKKNDMKDQLMLVAVFATILVFGFQTTYGQDEIYRSTQEQIDEINEMKKDVDNGTVTKSNWDALTSYKRGIIRETLDMEARKQNIESNGYTPAGKKALTTAYEDLAKSLAKKGIAYEEPMDVVLKFIYDEIVKTTESVDSYKPGDLFMVSGGQKDWLLRSVSKKEYQAWLADSKINWSSFPPVNKKKFDEAFAALNASASKKIPTFKPNEKNFSFHNATDEAMMKKELGSPSSFKIHQIGLAQDIWTIDKNELDIPKNRFKVGYVWAKDSRDDFAFCRLIQVNIIQDYAGGGKYGQTYALNLGSWLVGCP